MDILVDRDLDHLARRGLAAAGALQCPSQIDPVEAQYHIRRGDQLGAGRRQRSRGAGGVQRVIGRKSGAGLAVGHHPRADRLGEFDAPLPRLGITGRAPHQDDRTLGAGEQFGRLAQ